TLLVERERANARIVMLVRVALEEVLLNVRRVEVVRRGTVVAQISSDGPNGLVAGKITHDRDQQVVSLELTQYPIIFFISQIAVVQTVQIGRLHQFGIAGEPWGAAL